MSMVLSDAVRQERPPPSTVDAASCDLHRTHDPGTVHVAQLVSAINSAHAGAGQPKGSSYPAMSPLIATKW
jgi:hypothetical protein